MICCNKCGAGEGNLVKKEDLLWKIEYIQCVSCGTIYYLDNVIKEDYLDGEGYHLVCTKCGIQFRDKSSSAKVCKRCGKEKTSKVNIV